MMLAKSVMFLPRFLGAFACARSSLTLDLLRFGGSPLFSVQLDDTKR